MFLLALIGTLWAADVDYTNVNEGDPAPFTGKLLTSNALAQIIATHEKEIMKSDLDSEFELQKKTDELNLKYDIYSIKCEANIEMYKQMIALRDEEIQLQLRKDWIQRLAFYGGFAIGTATTIGIVYSVNQN
jgi:hypothetical protein|tara:strand:+ start:3098 stop:3493 length:396 start_codon:yes stop_codon:yes gene_type:complete